MELVKAGVVGNSDERRILLFGGTGFAYDIWLIHYNLHLVSQWGDNNTLIVGLSTKRVDQVNDAATITPTAMARDPQVFGIWSTTAEKPTDVGISATQLGDTIAFPRAYRVPWLALLYQASISPDDSDLSAEVYFDRVKVSQEELAFLAQSAGGQTRT